MSTKLPPTSSSRIVPTLLVLGLMAATGLAIGVPAYWIGKQGEDQRDFLKSFRAPFDFEAQAAITIDYAAHSNEANDVIFLGDSTCISDVHTLRFEQLTGLRAYNLGCPGVFGMEGCRLILETYLRGDHPKPGLIVLCVAPQGMSEAEADRAVDVHNRFLWAYGPGTEDTRPPHRAAWKYYIGQALLTGYGRMQANWDRQGRDIIPASDKTYGSYRTELLATRGFCEFVGGPRAVDVIAAGAEAASLAAGAFAIDSIYTDEVRAIGRIAAAHGIPLLVRLAPVRSDLVPRLGANRGLGDCHHGLRRQRDVSAAAAARILAVAVCRRRALQHPGGRPIQRPAGRRGTSPLAPQARDPRPDRLGRARCRRKPALNARP